jgi:hypothetical protein
MRYLPGVAPPGIIGIVSGELTRYADFSMALLRLHLPADSHFSWGRGVGIAGNLNLITRNFLASPQYHWLWLMGDDHTFAPTLLLDLLARDVPVIAPICAFRSPPYIPHVYRAAPVGSPHPFEFCGWDDVQPSGIQKVDACGSAGMLIQRAALEALTDPWFEVGRTAPDALGEDLWLCKKFTDAGIPIHIDCDHVLNHQTSVTVVPRPGEGVRLDLGHTFSVDFDITSRPDPAMLRGLGGPTHDA